MPKHHKHRVGSDLIGTPDELIEVMIKNPTDQKWILKEVVNEGPPHKQVLTALLLKRLYKLVKTLEESTGTVFELQKGNTMQTETQEQQIQSPIQIPVNLENKVNKDDILNTVSRAPAHELLAYSMCLQVIEWGIKAASVMER